MHSGKHCSCTFFHLWEPRRMFNIFLFFPTFSARSLCTSVLWRTQRTKCSFTKRTAFPATLQLQTRSSWSITRTGQQVDTRPYQETIGSKFLESIRNIRKDPKRQNNFLYINVPLHEAIRDKKWIGGGHISLLSSKLCWQVKKPAAAKLTSPKSARKSLSSCCIFFFLSPFFYKFGKKHNPSLCFFFLHL